MLQFPPQPMSGCPVLSWAQVCDWHSLTHSSSAHPMGLGRWNWRCRKLLGKALICSNNPWYGFNIFSEYISETLQDFLGSCICSAFLLDWKLSQTIQFNGSPTKPWFAITLSFLWSQKCCYLDSLRGAAGTMVLTTHLVHINLSPPCAGP